MNDSDHSTRQRPTERKILEGVPMVDTRHARPQPLIARVARVARVAAMLLPITVLLAVAPVADATSGPGRATSSVPISSDWVNLVNDVTGKCADLPDFGAGHPDGPVTQFTCNFTDEDNQRWRFEPHATAAGNTAYSIENKADGLCLDLPGFGPVSPGTAVSEYWCAPDPNADNQLFEVRATTTPGAYMISNVASPGLCLDVDGVRTGGDDARLTLWPCSTDDDHIWALRTAPDSTAGSIPGTVATNGATLRVRTGPSVEADLAGQAALGNGTQVHIRCVSSDLTDPAQLWYRLINGAYVAAWLVTAEQAAPSCGGGPPADLSASLDRANTFRDARAAWDALGSVRRAVPAWRARYGTALARIAKATATQRLMDTAHRPVDFTWDTGAVLTKGDTGTEGLVRAVYAYYADLFAQAPHELLWAGLASLAGGPVYAGIEDAAYVNLPGNEELARNLQAMQREIFEDLAWQQELYLATGIDGIRAVAEARDAEGHSLLPDAGERNTGLVNGPTSMLSAWEDIASGNPARIERAARVFVAREQDPILQDNYDDLVAKSPQRMEFTSQCTRSPIPGDPSRFSTTPSNGRRGSGNAYPSSYASWHDPTQPINIGWWEDRSKWMLGPLMDAYLNKLRTSEGTTELLELMRIPVNERAAEFRLAKGRKPWNWHAKCSVLVPQ